MTAKINISYKVSGHDSFVCRYAWLPKAVEGIQKDPTIFSDEDQAIVEFGIGKNMVKSLRFWLSSMGIADYSQKEGFKLTKFGERIFLGSNALDPYLEDLKTLWLLHWNISSNYNEPLLAWDFLLNRWHNPDITPSKVLDAFEKEIKKQNREASEKTLKDHLSIFLHTYIPTKGPKGEVKEDNLDSPLSELGLILENGFKKDSGKRETIYKFNKDEKHEVTNKLFVYSIIDFRNKLYPNSQMLSFKQIAMDYGSPGQIYKIPESAIRERLENIELSSNKLLNYQESANSSHVHFSKDCASTDFLEEIYND